MAAIAYLMISKINNLSKNLARNKTNKSLGFVFFQILILKTKMNFESSPSKNFEENLRRFFGK